MNLYNRNVLAISPSDYVHILRPVYECLNHKYDANIHMIVNSLEQKSFDGMICNKILLPHWYYKQAWESSQLEVEKIKDLITACEKKIGVPLNRIILSRERDIGRAYSKNKYYWEERWISKLVRKDNMLPGRIIMRGFKFAYDLILSTKPDFILGGLIGGLNGIFYFIAKALNIPIVSCVYSPFLPDRHSWVSSWGSINESTKEIYLKKINSHAKVTYYSQELIEKFCNKPAILPIYAREWQKLKRGVSLYSANKKIINRLKYRVIPFLRRAPLQDPKPFWACLVNSYRTYFIIKLQKKIYSVLTEKQLSKLKYIYFPLHMEPEHVLNVRASSWYDQLNVIRMLSYNLPAGYHLLVKEHRYNLGRRSSKYLNELKSFPGTILIDPFDDQFKYIKNADLIVTINGTTGFEGLMLKRPVLTLSSTTYDCMSLSSRLIDIDNIGAQILDILSKHTIRVDWDYHLGLFLDAENEATLKDGSSVEKEIEVIMNLVNKQKCLNLSHDNILI